MRSLYSGHITFGLISIPVGLYAAIEASERVSFHLFHRKDMAPIRFRKFCSKEGVEVPNDEIVKGHEGDGQVTVVEKKELEEIESELGAGDHVIDVLQFVDVASLSPLSFERPYYLAPGRGGEKA